MTISRVKIPFSGGCACGAIRYECSAEPVMMLKCHCRNCQQMTGSGFSPAVLVPAEAFRVTRGQLRYHFTPSAAGGQHKRGFCAECGSLLTGGENTERPKGVVGVTAGSLDDPSWFQTRNRGTKWIRRYRNSSSIRRQRKNRDTNFTNRHELIGVDSTVFRFVTNGSAGSESSKNFPCPNERGGATPHHSITVLAQVRPPPNTTIRT